MSLQFFTFISGIAFVVIAIGLFIIEQKKARLEKLLPFLISISAGILLALTATEFLPHSFKHESEWTPLLLMLGVAIIIFCEKVVHFSFGKNSTCCPSDSTNKTYLSQQAAFSTIACIIVCAFFNGLEIIASFQINQKTGMMTGLGLALHVIPEGALAASICVAGQLSKTLSRLLVLSVGLALLFGAICGAVLSINEHFLTFIFPAITGILIYITFSQLIPIAIKMKRGVFGLLIGIGIILLVSSGHHH